MNDNCDVEYCECDPCECDPCIPESGCCECTSFNDDE